MAHQTPILLINSPRIPAHRAEALARELGATLTTAASAAAGRAIVLDASTVPPTWLRSAPNPVVCVPPEAPLAQMNPYTFAAIGASVARLVLHSPLHYLYAQERLGFPAAKLELIPIGVDVKELAQSTAARDPRLLVVLDFEGGDHDIATRAGLQRDAQLRVVRGSDRPELIAALRTAGVVIVSTTSRETAQGSEELLSAMAAGAPVVATRAWGLEHLMVDEIEGIFVPVGDAGALRENVRRLLSDPTAAAEFGARAAAKVSASLTMAHYAARLRRILLAPATADSPEFFLIPAHGRSEPAALP